MSLLDSLKHAFAVDSAKPIEPTDQQRELVDRLCQQLVRRRLTTPALMMLEMSRPLNFLAAQTIHFFSPLIAAVSDSQGCQQFAAFLEHRQSIEYLCERIIALENDEERVSCGESSADSSDETVTDH